MSISLDVIRNGKAYRLTNFGDTYEFVVEEFIGHNDFVFKDLHTLEKYKYSDLVRYGKSKDFSLEEM